MSNNNDKDDDIITGEDLFDEPAEENLEDSVEKDYSEQSKVKDAYKKAAAKKGRKKINKASYLSIGAILAAVSAVMILGYSSGSEEKEQNKKGSGSVRGSKVSINTSKASQVKVDDSSRLAKATSEAEKHRLEKAQKSEKSALKTIQEVNQTEYVLVDEPEPEESKPTEPKPVQTGPSKPRFRSLSPEQRDMQLSRLFLPLNGAALPFNSKSSSGGQGQLLQVAASKDIEKASTFTEVSSTNEGSGEYELEGGGSPSVGATRVNGSPVNQSSSKQESKEVFTGNNQQSNNDPQLGIHINYGEMFYGITRVEVNSDEPSFVWADVINGELRGARLHAKAAKFNGETVVIVFEKMVYKDKTYDVNIVALDPETKRSGIVDDIDRHPEKWFYFTLAALGEGFINAVSSTTSINGANGTVTTEEGVDDSRVAEATGANVLKRLLPTAESYLQVKNTIIAYEGREVIFYVASELNL